MNRDEILEHDTRGRIHGYLLGKGIAHYNEIKRDLGLNNGSASHHLRVMEKKGIIRSIRKGAKRLFYIGKLPEGALDDKPTPIQNKILELLEENINMRNGRIAKTLGLSPSTVTYHMKKLEEQGIIEFERHGMYRVKHPEIPAQGYPADI